VDDALVCLDRLDQEVHLLRQYRRVVVQTGNSRTKPGSVACRWYRVAMESSTMQSLVWNVSY